MTKIRSAIAVAILAVAGFMFSVFGGGTSASARDTSLAALSLPTTDGGVIAPSGLKFPAAQIPCPPGTSEVIMQVPSTSAAIRIGPSQVSGKSGAERGIRLAPGESTNWEAWPVWTSAESTTDAGSLFNVVCGVR